MNRRDEILGQLAPGLSAGEWKEQGEQLFLSLAAGEQQASMELIRPNINRRSVGTILIEYADNMKWLAAQQPFQHRRNIRRGKRGGVGSNSLLSTFRGEHIRPAPGGNWWRVFYWERST